MKYSNEVSPTEVASSAQDIVREILVRVTGIIPNEEICGIVFGVALIATDHLFNIYEGITS